ncbi:MAG: glycosyltransferase, partial [Halieaceae bacterium]
MGGAEVQAVHVATRLDRSRFEPSVMTFYPRGPLLDTLTQAGIPVISLDKKGSLDTASFFLRLRRQVMACKPNVIHSFLDSPNIIAAALRLSWVPTRLIWGIRSSSMELRHYSLARRVGAALERRLASVPDLIVCNSKAGRDVILSRGYPAHSSLVVANGIDVARFAEARSERAKMRASWGADNTTFLIGMVARLDPKKSHETFFAAAARAAERSDDIRFVLVADRNSPRLSTLLEHSKIRDRFIVLPPQRSIEMIYAGLDLNTLSSAYGEGFPNVVAEGMAAGCPTVATDTGDTRLVIGRPDLVVPPRDPEALADAWLRVSELSQAEQEAIGRAAAERIASEFSVNAMVTRMA